MVSGITVRPEEASDFAQVFEIHARAFPTTSEAELVESLRRSAWPQISLVASTDQGTVGHIFFSPVTISSGGSRSRAFGLGPLAVLPECRRQGAGFALVRAGLEESARIGENVVFVLGDPDFYARFGFRPAWAHELFYKHPGPNPAFQVAELRPGALEGRTGEVRYLPAFEMP